MRLKLMHKFKINNMFLILKSDAYLRYFLSVINILSGLVAQQSLLVSQIFYRQVSVMLKLKYITYAFSTTSLVPLIQVSILFCF